MDRATAVVTIKDLEAAKQRLAGELGPGTRRALTEAMLHDVLFALRRTRRLDRTLVVAGDVTAAQIAASFECEVIDDTVQEGQSAAAELGVRATVGAGGQAVALLPADCPMLDPAELDEAVEALRTGSAMVVPDRHGTGTNGLLIAPPDGMEPSFGEESRERHERLAREAGLEVEVRELASLAIDVDTPDDLRALREALASTRGRAPRTDGALRQMQLGAAAP